MEEKCSHFILKLQKYGFGFSSLSLCRFLGCGLMQFVLKHTKSKINIIRIYFALNYFLTLCSFKFILACFERVRLNEQKNWGPIASVPCVASIICSVVPYIGKLGTAGHHRGDEKTKQCPTVSHIARTWYSTEAVRQQCLWLRCLQISVRTVTPLWKNCYTNSSMFYLWVTWLKHCFSF